VEKAVRKLLVASQKSGVGKTTTTINLAAAAARAGARVLLLDADPLSSVSAALNLPEHPQRRALRQAGVDLPGVLVCNVVPGLDVLSPYEEGGCSDADLDRLLRASATPAFQESYGCLVVAAPPFLGANSGPLLAACDDYVVVMRAEPGSYRTLPAFLELVQRGRQGSEPIRLRGILVTLPEGEFVGGRAERELRGRLGGRILPQVIPFDAEAVRAREQGLALVQAAPESPAAEQYQALMAGLSLAEQAGEQADAEAEASLRRAAAAVQVAKGKSRAVRTLAAVAVPAADELPGLEDPPPPSFAPEAPAALDDAPDLGAPVEPEMPTVSQIIHLPSLPRRSAPAPRPEPEPRPKRKPRVEPPSEPAAETPAPAAAEKPAAPGASSYPWLIWIGAAIVFGVGLRYITLPEFMLPIAVGVAASAAAVLLLRLLMTADAPPAAPPKLPARPTVQTRAARPREPADASDAPLGAPARRTPPPRANGDH
jgi:chromosome partitioning protein